MRRFHLRIGQRLAFGYGFVIVLLIAMTLMAILLLGNLAASTDDALKAKYPNTQLVNDVNDELGVIARAMRNTLIMTEADQVKAQLQDIQAAKARLAAAMAQLDRRIDDAKGHDILQQIEIIRSAYLVNQEEFIELLSQHRLGEAKNLLLVDLHPYQNDFFSALARLRRHESALMDQARDRVASTNQTARRALLALTAVAAALSVAITAALSRSLLRQLGGEPDYATEIAERIAAGDLSSPIALGPRDQGSLLFAMKTMQVRLEERNAALQRANGELAASLDALGRTQEDLVRSEKLAALGSLVAGVAHELNTPIGNGLLAASSLVDHTEAFTAACARGIKRSELENHIDSITRAGDILMRNLSRSIDLVASFKQVAVDRQSSQGRKFKLDEMVSGVVLTLWPTFKKSGVTVNQQVPTGIVMDSYPGPLGQVLTNLINNAVVHGFEGRSSGNIWIAAALAEEGWVRVDVRDDGAGILPEHLKLIYDPFFTTRLGRGGSGLGLNIVYNIVHGILGGRIAVHSAPGQGTCFTLTLPLLAPH
ncbi:MAG: ATP-binding protein [Pseudomonadota bacterium]